MTNTTDVAIIGGGVIGCSIAYFLSKQGIRSTVFEQDRCGSAASSATAGVIGPLWHIDPSASAAFDLGLRSLDIFPILTAELQEAGIDPEFQKSGILKVALTPEDVLTLQDNLIWQGELGLGVTWLDSDEVFEREPEVTPEVLSGVFSPQEGHINGQRYVDALVHAAGQRGVTFFEGTEVVGLEAKDQKVSGVRTANESFSAGHTVLAAGPWTGIAERWVPEVLPVRPVKGQHILLRKAGFLPKCPVRNSVGYVIPQVDHSLLVASTKEEGKFDQEVTVDSISHLLAIAVASFPILKDATFIGARAGVRPGSPDDTPIMGPIPGWEGFSIASGHSYIGVILSPGTGELMANYISTGDASPLEPFSLSRFHL